MAGTSPTSRTLKLYRDQGYTAEKVEHFQYGFGKQDGFNEISICLADLKFELAPLEGWSGTEQRLHELLIKALGHLGESIPLAARGRRQDFAGFADVLAFKAGEGIVAIQSTSSSNLASRRTKTIAEPRALSWMEAGGRIHLNGWGKKLLQKHHTMKRWAARVEELKFEQFEAV